MLEEACNPAHPLLERLRFLSISGNNLDEFFMVRVAGLKGQQLAGVEEPSDDGLNPTQQLAAIAAEADALTASQQQVWAELREALRDAGVVGARTASEIGDAEDRPGWSSISTTISSRVLTPQAIDPAHPFPVHPEQGLLADLRPSPASPTASRSANC